MTPPKLAIATLHYPWDNSVRVSASRFFFCPGANGAWLVHGSRFYLLSVCKHREAAFFCLSEQTFFLSIYLSISTTAPQIAHLKLPLAFNLVIAYMLMLAKIHLYVVNLPSNVLFLSQLL